MKIVYYGFEEFVAPIIAAALHCGLLKVDPLPSEKEIIDILRAKRKKIDYAKINYFGTDEDKHQVYTLGTRRAGPVIRRTLPGILTILGIENDDLLLVDTGPCKNLSLNLGKLFCSKLNIPLQKNFFLSKRIFRPLPELAATVDGAKLIIEGRTKRKGNR